MARTAAKDRRRPAMRAISGRPSTNRQRADDLAPPRALGVGLRVTQAAPGRVLQLACGADPERRPGVGEAPVGERHEGAREVAAGAQLLDDLDAVDRLRPARLAVVVAPCARGEDRRAARHRLAPAAGLERALA